ncbi:MAG: RrF2 family transcriptional regulator [Planctomycetota bacterium]
MVSLSQTVGYAILALGCIANWQQDRALCNAIQKCTGIPMPYLRKLLYKLCQAGLIESKRGRKGGFVLARPAEEITVTDVMHALGHGHLLPECLLELPGCSEETPCPLRGYWRPKRAELEAELNRTTIGDAASQVVSARWGRLVCCPTAELPQEPAHSKATESRV